MKKISYGLTLILLLMFVLLPTFSSVLFVKAEPEDELEELFTVGTAGPPGMSNWDIPVYAVCMGDYYRNSAIEPLFAFPFNTTGELDDLVPLLATNWTIEERSDEMNGDGFINSGGIKSITLTLREGVTFHDGSNWNATVCKWNIDRVMYLVGNINGSITGHTTESAVSSARITYYESVSEWAPYETANWNVTQFSGVTTYAEYGNSADLTDTFPRFANVEIIENKVSGGTVKVNFNDWRTGVLYLSYLRMLSIEAYKNYFDVLIYGYGDDTNFPQNDPATFPGHLIGTGPYIFEEHNYATGIGTMKRFAEWWNSPTQQAKGFHKLERVVLTTFPHSESGYNARNLAMLTGDIDFAYDRSWEPLDPDQMKAHPDVNYKELGLQAYGENIVLNCINETYLRYWDEINLNVSKSNSPPGYPVFSSKVLQPDGTIIAHGVNRAFRKAISYAFDYNTYITTISNNRIVRSGGFLPKISKYYNPSINIPDTDLIIARQALIDDVAFWGPRVAARNLGIGNTTEEWNTVAATNPIYKMEYDWDAAHIETRNLMITALKNIGCGIILHESIPDTYSHMIDGSYTYPWFTIDAFAIKAYHRAVNDMGYLSAYYKSPTSIVERDKGGSIGVISDYYYLIVPPSTYLLFPYSQFPYRGFNDMSFNFNATCDKLLDKLWLLNETGLQETYDELSDWFQNFQYNSIWLGNDKIGEAINKNYECQWLWEVFTFDNAKKVSAPSRGIPGFTIGFVLAASLIGFVGIIYTIMREREKRIT
ncbi:MAG: ABC transporter substrate-binding protein [Promethearchaeota archaeon]